MLSLLVAVIATAAPEVTDVAPQPPPPPPRFNIYGSPISTAVAAGIALGTDGGGAYLPIGATFRAVDRLGFSFEWAGAVISPFDSLGAGWSISVAAGPTLFLEHSGVEGGFITLKGIFQQLQTPKMAVLAHFCGPGSCQPLPPDSSSAFLAGFDIGYTWRVQSFTIGAVLGLAAGYQENQVSALTNPLDTTTAFGSGFAWSVNFNFLRVGFAL
jgi:hypothetical protein